ncbi:MAG: Undecaprenyl-phosphate galactose phosphotransferase [Verrucomicrobiales bacterium]|nr:Undecaprenyl-phosphate galactose phosphotransferase [Verrucomicrobiales bacterium]
MISLHQARPFSKIPGWKRSFDIVVILIAAPFWGPVFLGIGLLIKIVSRGPIFFKQERVGFRGKSFVLLKFRTMRVNACTQGHQGHLETLMTSNAPMTKMDNLGDARLIPLGRLLRSSGLDELPQFVNVLKGEMSLIGPRPCTVYEYSKYEDWHKERFNALPGLTGLWQVSGKNKTTFKEMIQLDILYASRMSPGLDFKILWKTFPVLIGQVWEMFSKRALPRKR